MAGIGMMDLHSSICLTIKFTRINIAKAILEYSKRKRDTTNTCKRSRSLVEYGQPEDL